MLNYVAIYSRGVGVVSDRTWLESGSFWLKVYPAGFRKVLNFIKDEYGNPPLYVTENGVSERGPIDLNDVPRIHYYNTYINQALKGNQIEKDSIKQKISVMLFHALLILLFVFSVFAGWCGPAWLHCLVTNGQCGMGGGF